MNEQEVQAFFQQWNTYRAVIDGNHMNHQQVVEVLCEKVKQRSLTNLRVLELGGGDAYVLSEAMKQGVAVNAYEGIDLSAPALDLAKQHLGLDESKMHMRCEDMLKGIANCSGEFDLILGGYSLHHLDEAATLEVLRKARQKLSKNGLLFIYDLIHRNDESPQHYIARALHTVEHKWNHLTPEQNLGIRTHVAENDKPKSFAWWQQALVAVGFDNGEFIYECPEKLFSVLVV